MASYNYCLIAGNLGRDPEVRETHSGEKVANFSIATTKKWKNKAGEAQEATTWHNITCFGKLAELCGTYLKKGSSALVSGEMRSEQYEKDGEKKYKNYIAADEVQFLDRRAQGGDVAEAPKRTVPNMAPGMGEELPF